MKTFLYSMITVFAVVGCLLAFPPAKAPLKENVVSVQTTTVPTRQDIRTNIRNKKACKCCKSSLRRSSRQHAIENERKPESVRKKDLAS